MKNRFGAAVVAAALALVPAAVASAAELPDVWALTNGKVVTAPGKAIEKGTIVVRDGVIVAVGLSGAVAVPPDATRIDLAGKTVYPGLIDPYVTLGRLAGKKERPPDDDAAPARGRPIFTPTPAPTPEPAGNVHPLSRVTPERRASAEIKVDAEAIAALREAGFTVVQAVPDTGIFRGQSAVLSLGDGPVSRNLVAPKTAQIVSLDAPGRRGFGEYPSSKMGVAAVVRQTFSDARWFRDAEAAWKAKPSLPRPDRVEAWAALDGAVSGSEPVFFETSDVLALLRAGKLAGEFGLRPRIVGGGDAYLLMDEVKALSPEIILTLDFPAVPAVDDDDDWTDVSLVRLRHWDNAPSNPRWLRDAGMAFALTTHRLPEVETLADRVRKARARGLSADDVLAAFTTIPAKMLGIEGRAGEIAPGKAANLVVVEGTLFGDKSRVVATWVDGKAYEAKPKKGALAGTYRLDAGRLELRIDPKTGMLTAAVTPDGGRPVAAADVSRHGLRAEFEIDGTALGLAEGAAAAVATVDGDVLTLSVTQGGTTSVRRGLREKRAPGRPDRGADAAEPDAARTAEDAPDSDVRPLPSRFASPLLAPRAVFVRNATIWTSGPQGIFEKANLLVLDGKVAAVGPDAAVPPGLAASALEIDAAGKVVTPGLIDAHSHTAIDGSVNEGTHNVSAEVRIADVVDPLDVAIYRELAGGLTAANVLHGSANAIGGQNAIYKMRFGAGPDGILLHGAPPGIKFALGENPKQSNWQSPRPRYPQTRMGVSALIRERFLAARDYRRKQREAEAAKKRGETVMPVETDFQLEAIAEVLEGKRLIHAHSYVKQEILDLIRLCEEFGVKVATFQHVLEGYKVADEIAAHGAGASSFSDWWAYKFEVYDAIPYSPALMRERGVLVTLNSDSDELARRLNLEAAKAVKYGGVPPEEALKFVTWNAAKQLGLEKRIGSLEPGKDADFVLWTGDPLDTRTVCLETWIDGKKYFDRETDLGRRALLGAEKSDLIAKARAAAARGGPAAGGAPSQRPPEDDHACDRLEDRWHGEVIR